MLQLMRVSRKRWVIKYSELWWVQRAQAAPRYSESAKSIGYNRRIDNENDSETPHVQAMGTSPTRDGRR